jgi:translation initiation factor IF-3
VSNETRINERIRAREVLVIDDQGNKLGVKPLPEALHLARQADLDLVEVAPMANPPVCRIMNYSRFKYETEQRAKESRRKTSNVSIKEMKYRPKIGPGDFETKTRQVSRFLGEGHKVKITIMFRGREMSHPELGKKILDKVAEEVVDLAKVEAAPKLDGRNMLMVLAPDKRAQQAAAKAAAEGDDDTGEALAEGAVAVLAPEDVSENGSDAPSEASPVEAAIEASPVEPSPVEASPNEAAIEASPVEIAVEQGSVPAEAPVAAAPQTQET